MGVSTRPGRPFARRLGAVLTALALSSGGMHAETASAAPEVLRVYVRLPPADPSAPETPAELEDLQHAVGDVAAALADRKKTFAVVDALDKADVVVEVIGRSVTVPKIVFAPSAPMGQPGMPGPSTPARAVHLRVRVTYRAATAEFANKNQALESNGGSKSAAEDLAKQLDLWVHRPAGF
jgi:hypothetical protein